MSGDESRIVQGMLGCECNCACELGLQVTLKSSKKDVLRRNMVYYLGQTVHICKSHKRCTAQKHGVLPGPRGTYLCRILLKMYCAETWCTTWDTQYRAAKNPIKAVLRRNMVYYLDHAVHIWQNPIKDVLRRNMVYYLGHAVHICAEPYKRRTAQEHGGPRGTYLRRTLKKMYCAETWRTTWATGYISAQNPIKDVLRRNMVYYLGHAVRYISAQKAIKDVLRRNMVYYLGHAVHICAESSKRCTAQEHDVLPGPRGVRVLAGKHSRHLHQGT
jgi:hypothetical protein